MDEPSPRLLVTEAVVSCTRCPLHEVAIAPVAFSGPTPAEVCVLGEAPGRDEDSAGEPFVGISGQLLREHLGQVGFQPDKLAFVNTVSCWPGPEIKNPEYVHVNACRPNKEAQIDLVDPQWVLAVGKIAAKALDPRIEIKYGRGRPWMVDGRVYFVTYHPAAAARNGLYEKAMHEDLERFKELTDAGVSAWESFVGDRCFACNNPMFWMEPTGLTWCEIHMPEEGHARKALLAREYQQACARLEAANAR